MLVFVSEMLYLILPGWRNLALLIRLAGLTADCYSGLNGVKTGGTLTQ
jgi:hypothetical protein